MTKHQSLSPLNRQAIFDQLATTVQSKISKQLAKPLTINKKPDGSSVTEVEHDITEYMVGWLKENTDINAVVAEEQSDEENQEAASQECYWELDALDGTAAFIDYHKSSNKAEEAEFSVLLSLIENGSPTFGAIWFPIQQTLYSIDDNGIAFEQKKGGRRIPLKDLPGIPQEPLVITQSPIEFSNDPPLPNGLNSYEIQRFRHVSNLLFPIMSRAHLANMGSGFKTWDVSALHAIAKAAGAECVGNDGKPLKYGSGANGDFTLPAFKVGTIEILGRLNLIDPEIEQKIQR